MQTQFSLTWLHHELYHCVDTILREHHDVLVEEGYNHPNVTAGKITGMIIDAYTPEEILLCLGDGIGLVMADAVFTIADKETVEAAA